MAADDERAVLSREPAGGLKVFARNEPSILLLGHDPGVPERLANKQVLFGEGAAYANASSELAGMTAVVRSRRLS